MAVLEVFLRTSQTPSINDNKNPKMGNIHVAKPRVIPRNQYYAEMFKPCLDFPRRFGHEGYMSGSVMLKACCNL